MSSVSELDVALWGYNEVRDWAIFYGFKEEIVISNIFRYKLCGTDLLAGTITDYDLGITIPLAVQMYEIRTAELKERHRLEKRNSCELTKNSKVTLSVENGTSIFSFDVKNSAPILSILGMKRDRIPDFINGSGEDGSSDEDDDESDE
jgi:hypothetical protein